MAQKRKFNDNKKTNKDDTSKIKSNPKSKSSQPVLKKPKKSIKILSKTINYSICIPTSILDNCHNLEQITSTLYQIAKTATIYNVGEIVILQISKKSDNNNNDSGTSKNQKKLSDSVLIASLLQYFVTPPYLVNTVFKKDYHKYFKYASKLPRLSALPFMRYLDEDNGRYREGLTIRMSKPSSNNNSNKGKEFKQTKYVNVGKPEALELKTQLVPVNVRVTVDTIEKKVVSPQEAYGDFYGAQFSYGYHVRIAQSFGNVFTECSFKNGYSQAVWINSGDYYYNENLKKYNKIENNLGRIEKIIRSEPGNTDNMSNLLLVFGKWDHVKKSFNDSKDQFEGCEGAHQFFDGQLELPGTVPHGRIQIQDSCMISLTLLSTM
ncbi:hypothetical protein Kpol_1060p5 [Vanderwaltozyma polyspora DSM 70294]|uniref:Uncharacterized protein n=1 Tax=Vanderwaltozyma polyspora (strain ATCC 22028 / DSM 70294 / BCRC 21397 / CBS 2163 / NBRC 10782 / NRRL Y-8283 / UCD 57-17) TaxID=436907 RepID=A7TK06_VANPO|nr:uncharacterized protein Kpol_1060p5 [Vanderwaltozyma polyspora DSM 70294]EDO17352.1 hypothetical protein Kpol_1060p5 [Vanderwaltozyma polyspora DSM 70294]